MGIRPKNTARFSVQCTQEELDLLDDAALHAGLNRNRFIRQWIASLFKAPERAK